MRTSESIAKIAPALVQAQKAISYAVKNESNPFFKNRYADLPAVIDAIKAPLNDAGIVFLQTPSPSDDGKLHLTTRLIHESGEWIEDTAVTSLSKPDPQGFGSAVTYLRRYSLASFIGLYQDDDDGAAACQSPKTPKIEQKGKVGGTPPAWAKAAFPDNFDNTPSAPPIKTMTAQAKKNWITTALIRIDEQQSEEDLGKVEKQILDSFKQKNIETKEIEEAINVKRELLDKFADFKQEDVPQ